MWLLYCCMIYLAVRQDCLYYERKRNQKIDAIVLLRCSCFFYHVLQYIWLRFLHHKSCFGPEVTVVVQRYLFWQEANHVVDRKFIFCVGELFILMLHFLLTAIVITSELCFSMFKLVDKVQCRTFTLQSCTFRFPLPSWQLDCQSFEFQQHYWKEFVNILCNLEWWKPV